MNETGFPTEIGAYTIVRELGRGGMGIVYLATQAGLKRQVALKVLNPDMAGDTVFAERFHHEAEVLARVDSPHIIAIYDHGQSDRWLYLATQYVAGGDLATYVREHGAFDIPGALAVFNEILWGLKDAHSAGVLHRDVKPSNILLRADRDEPYIYLCDFGIAQTDTNGPTRTGFVAGSVNFMAPERHEGKPATVQSDLYSAACVLWVMLTGDMPYSGTEFQVAMGHLSGPIPQLMDDGPEVDHVNRLLRWCLAKDPFVRPVDASAAIRGVSTPSAVPEVDPVDVVAQNPIMVPQHEEVVALSSAVVLNEVEQSHPYVSEAPASSDLAADGTVIRSAHQRAGSLTDSIAGDGGELDDKTVRRPIPESLVRPVVDGPEAITRMSPRGRSLPSPGATPATGAIASAKGKTKRKTPWLLIGAAVLVVVAVVAVLAILPDDFLQPAALPSPSFVQPSASSDSPELERVPPPQLSAPIATAIGWDQTISVTGMVPDSADIQYVEVDVDGTNVASIPIDPHIISYSEDVLSPSEDGVSVEVRVQLCNRSGGSQDDCGPKSDPVVVTPYGPPGDPYMTIVRKKNTLAVTVTVDANGNTAILALTQDKPVPQCKSSKQGKGVITLTCIMNEKEFGVHSRPQGAHVSYALFLHAQASVVDKLVAGGDLLTKGDVSGACDLGGTEFYEDYEDGDTVC